MSESKVQPIMPKDAYELSQNTSSALLIDVRSGMEFLFVGHPVGAIHVPWIDEPDWTINPDFVKHVRQVMLGGMAGATEGGGAPVLLICRSGKRSLEAGAELVRSGFSEVYNILEGFEGELNDVHQRSSQGGWRFHGLPWEQC
ncbi:MAG: rhodanese-like domain-containing protein [Gammaproteobacteria bacterium]|nr:rhodanese-like domain-containing protein [Gammaproteobacteria bacterium]